MLVHLSEIRESGVPFSVEAELAEKNVTIDREVARLSGPVRFQARVSVAGERVKVKGSLEAGLQLVCCRCLRLHPLPVSKGFDLEYWPDPPSAEGEEHSLDYEDLTVGFYREDVLDLSGVICEQIVLEIPMKPVCDDECKGLCDQCGANLNEGECGCDRSVPDPRLAALEELKRRLN